MNSNPSPTSPARRRWAIACAGLLVLGFAVAAEAGWLGERISGSGQLRTEQRTPGAFTAVELRMDAQVELRQGAASGVSVETDENLLPYIETAVERGTLVIREAPGRRNLSYRTLKLVVQSPQFERVAITGSGEVNADTLRGTALKLSIAGSGDIHIKSVALKSLATSTAGSGDIKLGGTADEFSVSIKGSGDVDAAALKSAQAKVRIAGSGSVGLWATEQLDVRIAGSGGVTYWGNPSSQLKVSGSGEVKRLGASPP